MSEPQFSSLSTMYPLWHHEGKNSTAKDVLSAKTSDVHLIKSVDTKRKSGKNSIKFRSKLDSRSCEAEMLKMDRERFNFSIGNMTSGYGNLNPLLVSKRQQALISRMSPKRQKWRMKRLKSIDTKIFKYENCMNRVLIRILKCSEKGSTRVKSYFSDVSNSIKKTKTFVLDTSHDKDNFIIKMNNREKAFYNERSNYEKNFYVKRSDPEKVYYAQRYDNTLFPEFDRYSMRGIPPAKKGFLYSEKIYAKKMKEKEARDKEMQKLADETKNTSHYRGIKGLTYEHALILVKFAYRSYPSAVSERIINKGVMSSLYRKRKGIEAEMQRVINPLEDILKEGEVNAYLRHYYTLAKYPYITDLDLDVMSEDYQQQKAFLMKMSCKTIREMKKKRLDDGIQMIESDYVAGYPSMYGNISAHTMKDSFENQTHVQSSDHGISFYLQQNEDEISQLRDSLYVSRSRLR